MNRFEERIEEGFDRLSGHATPSSTAFETFRTRIAEEADQPEVEIIMLQRNEQVPGRQVPAWMRGAAAAAVIVIAAIAAIVVTNRGDETVIVDQPTVTTAATTTVTTAVTTTVVEDTTPEQTEPIDTGAVGTAMSFFDARNAYDADATSALFAPDATVFDFQFTRGDRSDFPDAADVDWAASADFERVTGNMFTDVSCEETEPGKVTCQYSWENDWTRALDVSPASRRIYYHYSSLYEDLTVVYLIADDQIQSVQNGFPEQGLFDNSDGSKRHVYGEISVWVRNNHTDDWLAMIGDGAPHRTAELIPLWETYTQEFVAYYTAPAE